MGVCLAMAAAWLGYGEGGGGFELDGAGKEDVVFQVHVLAEVVLELLEAGVEDAVAEADAEGRGEVVAELADLREQDAGFFVIVGEDGDGFGEEAIAADGVLVERVERALDADDVGEEDGLFLGEVFVDFDLELGEGGVDGGEFGVGSRRGGRGRWRRVRGGGEAHGGRRRGA